MKDITVPRPAYLFTLESYIDVPVVKILAGIRRSGKSTIFSMFSELLRQKGVPSGSIIHRRYTSMEIDEGFTAVHMYKELIHQIHAEKTSYLLLDEVQEIEGWEKAVNDVFEKYPVDIYITGSNSRLMSSEISSYLSGRYVEIPVYTLSFQEYLLFKSNSTLTPRELLVAYIKGGGFPVTALSDFSQETIYQIVEGIYNSVVTNDIARRHQIKNQDLFNRTVLYVIENVGKTFSAHAIVKFLKNEGRKLSVETIYDYLDWLEKAFIIYRCKRYDLHEKMVLKTQEKFYLADSSLKYCIMGYNSKSLASMMENIVYLELKRRGYTVYIGKNGAKEIDFVAEKQEERLYIQVCRNLPESSDREISNLMEIKDHYPKWVITLDEFAEGNENGIQIMHLENFLLRDW
ncbi:MAG TPA: ATPase [Sphaerochaeta sp.]|nr:ATPase [Sphaerochaeta sp.]